MSEHVSYQSDEIEYVHKRGGSRTLRGVSFISEPLGSDVGRGHGLGYLDGRVNEWEEACVEGWEECLIINWLLNFELSMIYRNRS